MKLYHSKLGLPKGIRTNLGIVTLNYSQHARTAATNDRYGSIELPSQIDTTNAQVIEVECSDMGTVTKIVYRVHYFLDLDLVVVLIPQTRLVKTVWLNLKSDNHSSLDVSKYAA